LFYPPKIPDLIGLQDRRYFDASGLVRHRSIGDLMRYAALNQGLDYLSEYAGYRPAGELPDPGSESRYSDEQLYALGLFLYSLEPPPNPNPKNALAARGEEVFFSSGCGGCHTPPLYTSNQLTPAKGFTVPEDHPRRFRRSRIGSTRAESRPTMFPPGSGEPKEWANRYPREATSSASSSPPPTSRRSSHFSRRCSGAGAIQGSRATRSS
jgi:hypothetical protein